MTWSFIVSALALETIFPDRVDFLLHFVEQVVDFVLLLVGAPRAFGAGADDLAQDVFVAHDLEVVTDVRRRRDEGEKAGDERRAADGVEQVPVAQDLGEGDQVDALTGSSRDRPARCKSSGAPECKNSSSLIFSTASRDHVAGRDEHGAEHALLCFDAVGKGAVNIR